MRKPLVTDQELADMDKEFAAYSGKEIDAFELVRRDLKACRNELKRLCESLSTNAGMKRMLIEKYGWEGEGDG